MKKKLKRKNNVILILILVFVIILIISGAFLVYIYTQNYIIIENIDDSAYNIKKNIKSSIPIYINNILIGGVNNQEFVGKDLIYDVGGVIKNQELELYDIKAKIGTYNITSVDKDAKTKNIYIKTDRIASQSEYIGITKNEKNIFVGETKLVQSSKEDEKTVKKALGIYSLLNKTIKINEVYEITLKSGENGKIICATSHGKNKLGAYSIIVYSSNSNVQIIKYCYVKNTKRAVDFDIYSLKFVYDINYDAISEIIIQETNDYRTKYSVMQYKKNKFYQVLSEQIEL